MSEAAPSQAQQWLSKSARSPTSLALPAHEIARLCDLAIDLLDIDRADLAAALMQALIDRGVDKAKAWQLLALARRDLQELESAFAAIERAAQIDGANALIALARAQIAYETGRPSARLYQAGLGLRPNDPGVIHNAAKALAADGEPAAARDLLGRTLAGNPDWLDGHKALAAMIATAQGWQAASRYYAEACQRNAENIDLALAWFYASAHAQDWPVARQILEQASRSFAQSPALAKAWLYLKSESGDEATNRSLFEGFEDSGDIGLDLCRVRHFLRLGSVEDAEAIALRYVGFPPSQAAIFWPYLSTCWRLRDDPRAEWLDGAPPFIKTFDLPFEADERDALAERLRGLHDATAPFVEQSVRGGTQTSGPLLLRHEPEFQTIRRKILEAVRAYVNALPPGDARHPLLAAPRSQLLIEGSWSVRLASQGFHTCHTHTHGWISSALYISLPEPDELGAAPAGWIEFGTPPPELGLNLPPYRMVEPKLGRLVLFPSTLWHRTIPFEHGERMTIAFDVRRPLR
jgi:tetratricopeptide (TPR) repeat protein